MGYLPYGRQEITTEDIAAVTAALQSDWLTQGPLVPDFERQVALYTGAQHAVAVNSATSALHIACLALGLREGGLLWTSPNTFVASANCGRYCGAEVDFVDIDPRTFNMSVSALAKKLELAASRSRLPNVVIPVHFAGQSCDMQAISVLSRKYGFRVIEDASHAVGGTYDGAPIGSCRYCDIAIFSFHPVKIITAAEGGMALTNDGALAVAMAALRSHGIVRDQAQLTRKSAGPWYYEQIALGFNYRMSELHAALGISQLVRLDAYVTKRLDLAQRYDSLFEPLSLIVPWRSPDRRSAMHLYVVRIPHDRSRPTQRQVFERLRENGFGVNLHYIPVYRQPYYERFGFAAENFPECERYYSEAMSLPIFPTMTKTQQEDVVDAVGRAILP